MMGRLKHKLDWRDSLVWLLVSLVAASTIRARSARADTSVPTALETEYRRIVSAAPSDTQIAAFEQRIEVISEIGQRLAQTLAQREAVGLNRALGLAPPLKKGPGAAPTATAAAAPRGRQQVVLTKAAEIWTDYQDQFAESLPVPKVSEADLGVLRRYYAAHLRAVEATVESRGKVVAALNPQSMTPSSAASAAAEAEVPKLCVVLRLLHVSDAEWTDDDIAQLPRWMRTPSSLSAAEDFALSVQRPRTAYKFFVARSQRTVATPVAVASATTTTDLTRSTLTTFPTYVRSAADRLMTAHDYFAAMACLRAGIADVQLHAGGGGGGAVAPADACEVCALRLQLAAVLNDAGQPQLAAEEVRQLLESSAGDADRGKAAMFRLKYLHKAERFKDVLAEASRYQDDPKCASHLAQIMYLNWVAQTHENATEEAEKTQALFLQKFPDHPLGADMRFATAMSALAAGNYEEASRQLEVIRFKYPNEKASARAVELQSRLQKVGQKDKSQVAPQATK